MENNIENNITVLSKLVADAVVFSPKEVVTILNKTGVTIDAQNYDNTQMVDAVIRGLYSSESFRIAFFTLFPPKNEFLNQSGFDYGGTIQAGTQFFTSLFGSKDAKEQSRAIQAQANAQVKASEAQLEIARLNAQSEASKLEFLKNKPADGKSNTGLYIGLGVGGVLVLGLVVYFVVKK
jgi:hypothetical protein